MDCTISPLTFADYDAVLSFWKTQDGIGLNESDEPQPMRRFLERNPGLSLIARDPSGSIIAAVLCGHDGRRGYLHHLAVHPAHRRQGLGRQLVERCLTRLASHGIPKCNIFLFNNNAEGRKFWQRLGYQPVTWSPLQRVI